MYCPVCQDITAHFETKEIYKYEFHFTPEGGIVNEEKQISL